jgi:chromosome segregation ATPase
MAELREEVTRAQATVVMLSARAAHAEGMAREKIVLLATTRGEVAEATQRVSILGDELMAARRAWDVAEEKISSLMTKAATTDQRWEAVEEQWERLVHELTLLSLRGSELCHHNRCPASRPPARWNALCEGLAH